MLIKVPNIRMITCAFCMSRTLCNDVRIDLMELKIIFASLYDACDTKSPIDFHLDTYMCRISSVV